jgi:hypothetical protein
MGRGQCNGMGFQILNIFFHVTHVVMIIFILIGWAFQRTRNLHLIVLLLTVFSWFGLGLLFGWGYCFWTDWHWEVRDQLGKPHPASYVKLLADSVTGQNWNPGAIDLVTLLIFLFIVLITLYVRFMRGNR